MMRLQEVRKEVLCEHHARSQILQSGKMWTGIPELSIRRSYGRLKDLCIQPRSARRVWTSFHILVTCCVVCLCLSEHHPSINLSPKCPQYTSSFFILVIFSFQFLEQENVLRSSVHPHTPSTRSWITVLAITRGFRLCESALSCACSSCRVSLKTGSHICPVEERSTWWCRRSSEVEEEEEEGKSYSSRLAASCFCWVSERKKNRRAHHTSRALHQSRLPDYHLNLQCV